MVFTKVLIAGSAFFAAALAQGVFFTEWPTSVTAGQPTTLKWAGDAGAPVTLTLRKGASTALGDVEVISPDATNGEYTWTPSTDLENASDYAFQISQGDQINYSGLVSLGGGSDTPPPAPDASASGAQRNAAAATVSGTTMANAVEMTTSGADRAMITSAPSTDSMPTSASAPVSDAAATTMATSGSSATSMGSETSAQASETSGPSVVARPSLMNTPFNAANDAASGTASASSSAQTGAAGQVTVPVALGFVSAALLWCFQ